MVFGAANAVLAVGLGASLAWTVDIEKRSWPAVAGQDVQSEWSDHPRRAGESARWHCQWNADTQAAESRGTVVCRVTTGIGQSVVDNEALLSEWPGDVSVDEATTEWLAIDDPSATPDPAALWIAVAVAFLVAGLLASRLTWRYELQRLSSLRRWIPVAAGAGFSIVSGLIAFRFGIEPMESRTFWEWGLPAWLLMVVAVPLAEELNFRGVLYEALANRAPLWQQALLNALLFAGAHTLVLWQLGGGWTGVMAMAGWLLAGFYFFWVRHHSGSVLIAAIAHGILNGLSLAYLALVQGSSGRSVFDVIAR